MHDIIGPLLDRDMKGLLAFTRMTGDLVKAMRACPQPIIAAVDGVCVGAGAMIALVCDLRSGTPQAKTAFLFTRVGTCRLRHGRVRDAAARHRPGPRSGTAVHRPHDERGRGRAMGFFQSACRRRQARNGGARARAAARRGPDFRAHDDQDYASARNGR